MTEPQKNEIIKFTEECSVKLNKDGTMKIMGDCDGVTISNVEMGIFTDIPRVLADKDEN